MGTTADPLTYTAQGNYVIHWSFDDGHGNVSTANQNVIVKDDVAPVVLTRNISVSLVNGTASITADMVNNGSYDNCGVKSVSVSPAAFTCGQYGNNTVTLTVTDNNGNTATGTATVNVIGVAPVPAITISRTDNTYTGLPSNTIAIGYGAQSLTLTASNSTSAANASHYVWSPAAGLSSTTLANPVFTPTAAGTFTFNVTVTNEFGCTATASVIVNVIDVRCGDGVKVLVYNATGSTTNPYVLQCVSPSSVPTKLENGGTLSESQTTTSTTGAAVTDVLAPKEEVKTTADQQVALKAYPNPFGKQTTISFTLPAADQHVTLAVYNTNGVKVATIYSGSIQAGVSNSYLFDGSRLMPGMYFARLITSTGVQSFRLIMAQ